MTAIPSADVVATTLPDGGVVLLNLGTKRYFTLNETGSMIWDLLGKQFSAGAMAAELAARFDVSPEQAGESVRRLLNELAAQKLVHLGSPQR